MSSAARRLQCVNPLDDPSWDAKVAEFPGATFFHGADWASVLQETYGFHPSYLLSASNGRWDGVLPVMEADSWLTGRRGLSLPFTDHCAPLGADQRVVGELIAAATALAGERRWKHWELRGGTKTPATPAAIAFHGHSIALDASPARLFARCDAAARRAVRKAEANSVSISFAHDLAALRSFYGLLCQTRRRHGLPPQPWRFFENLQRHVLHRQHGCVVLAHVAGRPVAGAVFLHFGRSAIFKFGASDENFQHLRPNNLVLWRAIEWHARAGFSALDLGRTSLGNEGLRRFKLGWGATERRIEYVRFNCRTAAYVAGKDRATGWHSRLFRFVPSPLARLVGAVVYRHAA